MPKHITQAVQPAPVIPCQNCIVLIQVGDIGERRMQPLLTRLADPGAAGFLKVAEQTAERELLLVGDPLVTEHQYAMCGDRGFNRGGGSRVERLRQIDPANFGGEHGMQRMDTESHGFRRVLVTSLAAASKQIS